jgi:type I restriction enzyme S subunit
MVLAAEQRNGNRSLPSGWRRVRLGDVIAEAKPGFASGVRDPKGVVQLRMNNVDTRGKMVWSEFIRVPAEDSVVNEYQLFPGDLLFNNTNSVELVGKSALFLGFQEPVVYSNHFTRLRAKPPQLDPQYLAAWLLQQWQLKVFENICNRWIGQSAVKNDKLLALEIPLPPLDEQKRIAAILNEQMAAVERARAAAEAQLEAAKALPPTYFRQAFQAITPLAIGLARDRAPAGWRWILLTDVARLESGHTPSRYHPEWWGGNIPWIALPDIRDLDGKIAYETCECTNETGIANSSARVLPAGTVVLSRTASVGFVTVMGRDMATSQDFVDWVCGEELNPHFLAYLLRAARNYIRSLSSGAIHQTVYVPTVKGFQVCIPLRAEQEAIVMFLNDRLTSAERGRKAIEEELDTISKLPAALLRRAFSGEL